MQTYNNTQYGIEYTLTYSHMDCYSNIRTYYLTLPLNKFFINNNIKIYKKIYFDNFFFILLILT